MKSTICGDELLGDRGGIIQLSGTNTTPKMLKKNRDAPKGDPLIEFLGSCATAMPLAAGAASGARDAVAHARTSRSLP